MARSDAAVSNSLNYPQGHQNQLSEQITRKDIQIGSGLFPHQEKDESSNYSVKPGKNVLLVVDDNSFDDSSGETETTGISRI